MANMVELLRRMVRQQTVKVGGKVANIYQAVDPESPPLDFGAKQQWLWTTVPGKGILSIEEFFAVYATDGSTETQVLDGKDGIVVTATAAPQVQFLRGTARVPFTMAIPMTISVGTPQGEWAVYLNGILQRRGNDTQPITLQLEKGNQLIEVMAYADGLGVAVPKTLEISANRESLRAPVWESLTTGYVDAFMANPANMLSWFNDPRAGGWRVMRREPEFLGSVVDIGAAGVKGQFGLVVSGDQTGALEFGEELTAGNEGIGTVLGATFDETTTQTAVRVRLPGDKAGASLDWIGRPLGSGRFSELMRVRRAGVTGTVKATDPNVSIGSIYEYKLQSFGVIDETQVSPWSEIEYIRAGDLEPPGNIVFVDGYPAINADKTVTAKFYTPDDDDYAGVKVYYREPMYTGSVASATANTLTPSSGLIVNRYRNWTMRIFSGDNFSGDLYALVVSNDAVQFFISGDFFIIPNSTASLEVYYDRPVMTDLGLPSTEDQFVFVPVYSGSQVASGDYFFRTFDYSNNEQVSGAQWNPSVTGYPAPIFIAFSGEASIFKGTDPKSPTGVNDGATWLYVDVDEISDELLAYYEQSDVSPIVTPEQSNQNLAWRLSRQEGTIPLTGRWRCVLPCATKPGFGQRVYAFTRSKSGLRSAPYSEEVFAVDKHTPNLPAVGLITLTSSEDPVAGFTNLLSWTVPAGTSSTYPIDTVIFRNGYPLTVLPHGFGRTYPFAQGFADTNLSRTMRYDYDVFLLSAGVSGMLNTSKATERTILFDITKVAYNFYFVGFTLKAHWTVYFSVPFVIVGATYVTAKYSFDGITYYDCLKSDGTVNVRPAFGDPSYLFHILNGSTPRWYMCLLHDASMNVMGYTRPFYGETLEPGPAPGE